MHSVGGAQVISDARPTQAEIYAKAGIGTDDLQRDNDTTVRAPATSEPAETKV